MSFKHASIDAETNSLSCAGDIWVTLSESLRRSKIYLTSQSVASMWIPKVVSYISISVNFLDIKVSFTAITVVACFKSRSSHNFLYTSFHRLFCKDATPYY